MSFSSVFSSQKDGKVTQVFFYFWLECFFKLSIHRGVCCCQFRSITTPLLRSLTTHKLHFIGQSRRPQSLADCLSLSAVMSCMFLCPPRLVSLCFSACFGVAACVFLSLRASSPACHTPDGLHLCLVGFKPRSSSQSAHACVASVLVSKVWFPCLI